MSFSVADVQAIRENVLRVEFVGKVSLTRLLEDADASRPDKWSIVADASTVGLAGDPPRPVAVVLAELAGDDDDVAPNDVGRFVRLTLDRPMTPFPAFYTLRWARIFSEALDAQSSGSFHFPAVYRVLQPPQFDVPSPARDIASPQTAGASAEATGSALTLGTYGYGADGDYAFDEGLQSLKKRVIRRLITRKNGFAHLPGYGVGIASEGKKLATAMVLSRLSADAQAQIAREPDVAQVRVTATAVPSTPGLFRFRVAIRQVAGRPVAFDVPIQT